MSKGQRKMLWRRIRSRVKGLAAMIMAVMMVVGLMPATEVQAADQKAYYLFLYGYQKQISLTPGIVVDGLVGDIETARTKGVYPSWNNDILQLNREINRYGAVGDTFVDDDKAGGDDQIAYIRYDFHMCNFIGSKYQGRLKKGNEGNEDNSEYSIELENGVRYFKDNTTGKRFKTYLNESDKQLQINFADIMKRTSEATEVTGVGAGTLSTIKTGTAEEKLYYAVETSGSYFSMTVDGRELSWDGIRETKEIEGRTYYELPIDEIICTPFEITLQANKDYDVKYQIMDVDDNNIEDKIAWSIDIVGKENSGGDDPGKDDPGQGDPGQTVSENARTLVVKNKSSITKLFSKYGESGYKYRFKVEDKAQRKIARVTRKGKIRVKRSGKVKVSLFRKVKGGVWSKIEEQEIKTEKPIVKPKVTDLKVGDTLEASSFITNQKDLVNKPTSYVSTNTKVATVESKTGKIKILKKGSTKIKMIYGAEKGAAVYKTRLKVNQ